MNQPFVTFESFLISWGFIGFVHWVLIFIQSCIQGYCCEAHKSADDKFHPNFFREMSSLCMNLLIGPILLYLSIVSGMEEESSEIK